jgi:hypothetical protein
VKFTREQRARAVLLLCLLCLATVLPISTPKSNAAAPYSERLTIFDLRGSYFWELNFTGGNIALPFGVTPPSGVTYTITEVHYTSWQPEYYIFGSKGFNFLFGLQAPPSGVTVTINSPLGQTAASSFITSLSSGFHLNFLQVSTSGTNFTYYSNLNVTSSLFPLFWKVTSSLPRGLINLTSQSSIASSPFSVVSFSGTSSSNSIYLESLNSAIPNPNSFSLTSLFSNEKTVNVSSSATPSLSQLQLNVIGGAITNSTGGTTSSSALSQLGSLTTTPLMPGKPLPDINATIVTNFASLVVTRDIATATPTSTSGPDQVTIRVTNTGTATAFGVSNLPIMIKDDWWKLSSALSATNGNPTDFNLTSLAAGSSKTFTYFLSTGAANTTVTAPASAVQYSFSVGKANITRTAYMDSFTVYTNTPNKPVIVPLVTTNSTSIGVGENGLVNLTVWNRGNIAVTGLSLAGQPQVTFPSGGLNSGGDAIVNASVFSGSFTNPTQRMNFTIDWSAPSSGSANSSSVNLDYTFGSPAIPSISITKSITQKVVGGITQANISLSITNTGSSKESGVKVNDSFPIGLVVGKFGNFSAGAAPQTVTMTISSISASQTEGAWYVLNVTNAAENYILLPAKYSVASFYPTTVYTGNSTAAASLPLGLRVSKSLSYTVGFVTQNATETLTAENFGSMPVYGVNVTALGDTFLSVKDTMKYSSFDTLGQNQNFSAKFIVGFASNGAFISTGGSASFQFGGTDNVATPAATPVLIWSLPSVKLTPSTNSPVETHSFTITMSITNPSNLTISNVKVVFHLPKYLQYVGGPTFNQTLSTFGGNETQKFTMTVKSNSPYEYNITSPAITFQYAGETLHGTSNSLFLSVGDDIPIRYGIPIGIAILMVLLAFVGIRRVLPKRGEGAAPRR